MKPRSVIFDLDGTLIDSALPSWLPYRRRSTKSASAPPAP